MRKFFISKGVFCVCAGDYVLVCVFVLRGVVECHFNCGVGGWFYIAGVMEGVMRTKVVSHGDVIRGFRTMFGWGRAEFADMMGVVEGTIASWETGRTELRLSTVQAMAVLFEGYEGLFWSTMIQAGGLEGGLGMLPSGSVDSGRLVVARVSGG